MRQVIKRGALSLIAILLTIVTILPDKDISMINGATNLDILQGSKITTVYGNALKGSDGEVYYEQPFTAINYKSNGTYAVQKTKRFPLKELIGVDSSGRESWLYCVEKNMKFSRDGYNSSNIANNRYFMMNASRGTLAKGLNQLAKDKNIRGLDGVESIRYILVATIYGWQPNATMPAELSEKGLNDWDWYYGTQIVIWEFQQGIRQSPTQCDGNGYNSGSALHNWIQGRPAEYAYDYVLKMMEQHNVIPSFSTKQKTVVPTYTLTWNSTNQRYETTLTDTNGYLFGLQLSDSNVHVEKNGSQYTFWTTKTISAVSLYTVSKELSIAKEQKLLVWGTAGKQTMVSGMQDPVQFYLKLKTEKPTITVEKTGTTSKDIMNRMFYVYKDNASTACLTLITNGNGKGTGILPGEGSYRIEEQDTALYDVTYYINGNSTQTFTYPGSAFDANNNVTVKVDNQQKNGYLQIRKESEDGKVEGLLFQIQGNGVNITGTTNEEGYVVVNGTTEIPLAPGNYVIREMQVANRYEPQEDMTVTVLAGQRVSRRVTNVLKPAHLKIIKTSEDGVIAGFEFQITGTSATGKDVNRTVITGQDGTVSVEMEQGVYMVSEINIPVKYYTPSPQKVILQDDIQIEVFFENQLKPGYLQILKTSEDGISEGFKFQIEGNGLETTGYTNTEGYVVFGEKAYLVEAPTYVSSCNKYVVVDAEATMAQVFSDLGLEPNEYFIWYYYGSNFYPQENTVLSSVWPSIETFERCLMLITSGTPPTDFNVSPSYSDTYAQIVIRGTTIQKNAMVQSADLTKVQQYLDQSLGETAYPASYYIAAYDVDRDGTVTQEDYDLLSKANEKNQGVTGSTLLTVSPGRYYITELEVPDRYTTGFNQMITVSGEETKMVKVTNLLKTSGIKIVKKAEDGVIEGVQFQISGTTNSGSRINMVVTTDENGIATQKLDYGTYTITELSVQDRYIQPMSQTVILKEQDYVMVTFQNTLKEATLQLMKTAEDGIVADVQFRIQSVVTTNGSAIDQSLTTGADGTVSVALPQGTYVITELQVADRYVEPTSQTVRLTAGENAIVAFENLLKIPTLKIVKTAEDGKVAGIGFQVKGITITGEAYSNIFTTDENGWISTNIPQGTYIVAEIQPDARYEASLSQSVALRNDEVMTLSFHNILKEGTLQIVKTAEDGNISDIPFHVVGFGDDGIKVDATFTTDANGVVTIALKPGTYTVSEVIANEKYIIQDVQEVTVEYGQTVQVTFKNSLKKFQLTLTKVDGSSIQGLPQGEGTMEGAVYGLYKEDGTLLAQYTTDANGQFTTHTIPCESIYVQEMIPPKGYLLDETQYWLESSVDHCFLELTSLVLEVADYPVVGNISIVKKMGTEENWEYEGGAVFQVYLKSAGSYDAANEWERDLLITDIAGDGENSNTGEAYTGGEAGTKDLPMGTYIVHQVSGMEGFQLAEDIEVIIDEENTAIQLEILNYTDVELPFTGGSGTLPFFVSGIICMLMAYSIAIMRGKKIIQYSNINQRRISLQSVRR